MKLVNYYGCAKISERKLRQLVRYFAHDLIASRTVELTGLTRETVTMIFLKLRFRMAAECACASLLVACEVEADEFYSGVQRVRGK